MDQVIRIVIYIIIINIAYLIFSLIRQGFKHYANYIAQLLFLIIVTIWLLGREIASGWVLLISFIGIYILIILPSQLQRKIDSLIAEKRYDEIEFFAKLKSGIAWSNPNAHFQDIAEITSKYSESPVKLVERLKELLGRGEPYDSMTRNFLGFIHFNNRNFNDLINDLKVQDKPFEDHSFDELLYLVRAYLETTRYDEAISAQLALEKKANENSEDRSEQKFNLIISRLLFYSFMGWKEEYENLCNSKDNLNLLTQELKEFWRGVCYFNSGALDEGEKIMQDTISSLPEEAFPIKELMQKRLFGMIEHRIFFQKHVLSKLNELHEKYKTQFEQVINENSKKNIIIVPKTKITKILCYLITLVSAIWIVIFDVYDVIELLNMGAINSYLVKNGEYFRLISYVFIHIGITHLIMNMFALSYFGPPIETIAGGSALLLIFFGSSTAGGALSTYMGSKLTAGASGGILGLLSASIIFELFKIEGTKNFSNRFNLFFILIANIAFGFYLSGIDNCAHFGGLLGGAILGLLYIPFIKKHSLKRMANIISFLLVASILLYSLYQQIFLINSKNYYPLNELKYKSQSILDSLTLEIPISWEISNTSNEDKNITYVIKGPLGENLRIIKFDFKNLFNLINKESIVKEYIKNKNNGIEQSENLKLLSYTLPEKITYRENTYRIFWKIKVDEHNSFFEDHLIFENGNLYCCVFSSATIHKDYYESIIKHIIGSFK